MCVRTHMQAQPWSQVHTRLFQDIQWCRHKCILSWFRPSVSCHVLVLSELFSDYGRGRLQCNYKVLGEPTLELTLAGYPPEPVGLWQREAGALPELLLSSKLGPKSECLLPRV